MGAAVWARADTVTDFATLISGRDPITGHALTPQEMFVTWLAFSIPLVSASFLRGFADDAVEMADDLLPLGGEACSFSADTPVATAAGQTAIRDVAVGDQVLAWNEETNATGYYTVTATLAHADPVIVHLTVDGDPSTGSGTETIETTPEHPFYAVASAPWLAAGEKQGRWTPAGELKAGDQIQQADGTTGVVQAVVFEAIDQVMYNLTVDKAHTFSVGDGQWLVHNSCSSVFLDGVNLTHVFEGEINARGRAVGFHYAGGSWHLGKARIDSITALPDSAGVFKAKVSVFDAATSIWVAKGPPSSFFPSFWSEQQVVDEILVAFGNGSVGTFSSKPANYWQGVSPSGLTIGGYLNSLGDINTAYPIP